MKIKKFFVIAIVMALSFPIGSYAQKQKRSYQNGKSAVSQVIKLSDEEINQRVKELMAQMTLEEKIIQMASCFPNANVRLKIPQIVAGEALHGVLQDNATLFPQAIALGATWDPELIEKMGQVIGEEGRAVGIHQCFAPMLGLARDPRWGRVEESYGEDPYLVSRMGVAYINGVQGKGADRFGPHHMICTPKHFVADGESMRGGNGEMVEISETTLRETDLVPFEAAIREAHAGSIMPAHHSLNRIPCHMNKWLFDEVLRKEWGFDGFVTSDNLDINKLFRMSYDDKEGHYIAESMEEAARFSLEAGVDAELAGSKMWNSPDRVYGEQLVKSVQAERIPVSYVDKAVARILRAKYQLGLFGKPIPMPYDMSAGKNLTEENKKDFDPWATAVVKGKITGLKLFPQPDCKQILEDKSHERLALEIANKSIVLLKNEGALLPLDKNRYKKIAVIGPNANSVNKGGYSNNPRYFVTILDGIRNYVGKDAEVKYAKGCDLNYSKEDNIQEAVELAKNSDISIVVVGTSRNTMGENLDRSIVELTGVQEKLVEDIYATGKPVVVVLNTGGALAIPWIKENIPAILNGWYGGQEGGNAIAQTLFGISNPGGKLPVTFPYSTGMLPCCYNSLPSGGIQKYNEGAFRICFPFGYGLSYTTFDIGAPVISKSDIAVGDSTIVTVKVTNTGKRTGDEVVQLYVKHRFASTVRPMKELKAFQRITLQPGESKNVSLKVSFEQLKSWLSGKWTVEKGDFVIMVGPDSEHGNEVKLTVK